MKGILLFLLAGFLLFGVNCGNSMEAVPVVRTAPPPAAVTNAPPLSGEAAPFHDALAPYGRWFWLDPYGWVWTPSGMEVAWRPYTYGSWVYADCGWTWVSDFEWGWAPFHYGRWGWHAQHGWYWVPGSFWAPAWVAWQFGDIWCGWAALPPLVAWEAAPNWSLAIKPFAWCFVEQRDFLRHHLHDHVVVAARNGTLLQRTRDLTHFEARGARVANLSLSVEQIEQVTGRSVMRHKILDVESARAARASRSNRNELRLFRPLIGLSQMASTPKTFELHGSRTAPVPEQTARPTIDQLRHDELERRRLEASQSQQRLALEQWHQRELQQPPHGFSPLDLRERHLAEHRAFLDQLHREDELFESRAQERYNLVPKEAEQAITPGTHAHAGGATRDYR